MHHENLFKTFSELDRDVNRLARTLHKDLDVNQGDVVGVWSANCYSWIVVQYAVARIGAVLCTLNPFYQADELAYALGKAEVKVLFVPGPDSCQHKTMNAFGKVLMKAMTQSSEGSLPNLKHVVSMDEAGDGKEYVWPDNYQGDVELHTYGEVCIHST